MWGGAHRNYLSQSLIIKLSQSLGTPVPIAAKFHMPREKLKQRLKELEAKQA